MKIKGLRWYIISLIMLITIINYLDRGTLNYMWVANIDYRLLDERPSAQPDCNVALLTGDRYLLTDSKGVQQTIAATSMVKKEKDDEQKVC